MNNDSAEQIPAIRLSFLDGGGEMGRLTREKNWKDHPLGGPETWPSSLRIVLGIILHSRFPMFVWWGPELFCFYNDAYRPSLGNEGKHPHILGMPAKEAWPEIWETVHPMIEQVLKGGGATWNEDALIPIYRNGQIEDVYWTFSYSPVMDNNGYINGVLVTCTETTEKVNMLKSIHARENQLLFTIDAGRMGTWDLNPVTGRFAGNERLKDWFGLPAGEDIELSLALAAICDADRQRVVDAIAAALDPGSDGSYEIEYTVVNLRDGSEKRVVAKGRAEFNEDRQATRFSGTLEDITEEKTVLNKLLDSEYRFRTLIEESSVATALYTGKEIRIQYANDMMLGFWGKNESVIGKPIAEAVPELKGQGFPEIFDRVYTTGETYVGREEKAELVIDGRLQTFYFDFTYKALRNKDGAIYGIHHMAADVTGQVKDRQNLVKSDKRFRDMVRQAPVGITILRGKEFIVEVANLKYLEIIDRKEDVFVGRSLFEGLPEVRDSVEPLLTGVLLTGIPFQSSEFPVLLNRFGKEELVYFSFIYHPLKEDNSVTGIMVVAMDVTDSVKAKHNLAESERQFRNMVMQSPIPMTIVRGKDHVIELANRVMFDKIWRKKEEDVIGRSILNVFPELRSQKYEELLNHVFLTAEAHTEKESVAYVDGDDGLRKFFLDFEYAPLHDTEGSISGIMITVNDVTEKVEARIAAEASERRISDLLKTAPFPIGVFTGRDMTIEIANQSFIDIFAGGQYIIGKSYRDLVPELEGQGVFEEIETVLNTGIPFHAHNRLFKLSGEEGTPSLFYFNYSLIPLFTADGSVYGIMSTAANVTDLNLAKQKIEEDEARLNIIVEASELGIWELDVNTNTVIYTQRFLDIFGFDGSVPVNHSEMIACIHPDDLPVRSKAFRDAYLTGQLQYTSRIICRDGSTRWMEARGKVFYNEQQKPEKLIGTLRDITEEKNHQLILQEREQKFVLLADSMPQLVWTTDANGIPDYFNRAIYDYSGREAELAMKDFWQAIMHPEDHACSKEKWLQSLKNGHEYSVEHRFLRKDGIYRWQLSQAIPQRDEQGRIHMWVGTTTDIQEQKMFTQELERKVQERTREMIELNEELARSEARYHLMVSEIQDYAIFYLNTEGIIENWNKGAEKIKGYGAAEVIGKHFSVFYTDQDKFTNLPHRLLTEAAKAGKTTHEGMRVRKDGTLFWAKVVITAIQDEQEKIIGFSKITHDLTDKKEAEEHLRSYAEQLEEKNRQLEKMNSELQSFAYISSHDLQEPLRKIQIFAARVLDKEAENLSEKGRDYFHRMQQSANRMQTLIQDLLTYSRTTAAEHSFLIKNFTEVFDEVKQDLAESIRESNAVIEVLGEPCETRMIPFQMAQLLHNLLGNAIKFTREGVPPHITISCTQVNGAEAGIKTLNTEKYCHITIQDNGIGFEPQFSERIFEVFQRLHEKGEYTGTGIGLAIVKKIVENHSGTIIASGSPNQGARFDIYIPLR
jgi:PAS domain S-box-containing protein